MATQYPAHDKVNRSTAASRSSLLERKDAFHQVWPEPTKLHAYSEWQVPDYYHTEIAPIKGAMCARNYWWKTHYKELLNDYWWKGLFRNRSLLSVTQTTLIAPVNIWWNCCLLWILLGQPVVNCLLLECSKAFRQQNTSSSILLNLKQTNNNALLQGCSPIGKQHWEANVHGICGNMHTL